MVNVLWKITWLNPFPYRDDDELRRQVPTHPDVVDDMKSLPVVDLRMIEFVVEVVEEGDGPQRCRRPLLVRGRPA